jgi:hypothetical protein
MRVDLALGMHAVAHQADEAGNQDDVS